MNTQHQVNQQQYHGKSNAYLSSAVHAQGSEFAKMQQCIEQHQFKRVLDLGCGAGHVSYQIAPYAEQVIAYDVTPDMVELVCQQAAQKGLTQIQGQQGAAEQLSFADQSFDCIISRYSAHHWQHVGQAMQEIYRVLKPHGKVIFVDILGSAQPAIDTFLQTIEMIRDPSHVRDYSLQEWMQFAEYAGFQVEQVEKQTLHLDFDSWIRRMKTPENGAETIRYLQGKVSDVVRQHFDIQTDGSFKTEVMYLVLGKTG